MSSNAPLTPALAAAVPASAAERRFNAAQARLKAAFATLDAEIARQRDLRRAFSDQIAEFGLLQTDRARLALELENFRVRAARLEDANRAAAGRFANASGILRELLLEDDMTEQELAEAERAALAAGQGAEDEGDQGSEDDVDEDLEDEGDQDSEDDGDEIGEDADADEDEPGGAPPRRPDDAGGR